MPAGRRCVVEPGVVLDELNRALKPHGLWFPVDVSTASRATIGGMAGNNSCGTRSLRYGTMRDNVISIDAITANGTALHFGEMSRAAAHANLEGPDGGLFRDLLDLGEREAAEIRERFPEASSGVSAATTSTPFCRTARPTTSPISWSARKARWRSRRNWN